MGSWWRAYRRDGRDGLATRKGRPGSAELIGPEDRVTLFVAMADHTPEELLIGGPLWTRQAVVGLIRLVAGIDMTEQGVGLWLRRHGFTPQRPARRACEQQPAVVRAWLDEEYPAIGTRAKAEGAAIASVDQCGLCSDAAPSGWPWASEGRVPIVRVMGNGRGRRHVRGASRGALWFTVFTERFTAPVFTAFLDRVARLWGSKSAAWSDLRLGCCGFVLVDQAAEDRSAAHRDVARFWDRVVRSWWQELQCSVWSAVVVVGRVAVQHCPQVVFVEDEQVVGDFASDGPR